MFRPKEPARRCLVAFLMVLLTATTEFSVAVGQEIKYICTSDQSEAISRFASFHEISLAALLIERVIPPIDAPELLTTFGQKVEKYLSAIPHFSLMRRMNPRSALSYGDQESMTQSTFGKTTALVI